MAGFCLARAPAARPRRPLRAGARLDPRGVEEETGGAPRPLRADVPHQQRRPRGGAAHATPRSRPAWPPTRTASRRTACFGAEGLEEQARVRALVSRGLGVPTLVLHGEDDGLVPPEATRAFHGAPRTERRTYPGLRLTSCTTSPKVPRLSTRSWPGCANRSLKRRQPGDRRPVRVHSRPCPGSSAARWPSLAGARAPRPPRHPDGHRAAVDRHVPAGVPGHCRRARRRRARSSARWPSSSSASRVGSARATGRSAIASAGAARCSSGSRSTRWRRWLRARHVHDALLAGAARAGARRRAALVIARAVVRDLLEPREAARVFSRLMLDHGRRADPGAARRQSALLATLGWRSIFWVLAAFGLACIGGVLHDPARTRPDGGRPTPRRPTPPGMLGTIAGDAARPTDGCCAIGRSPATRWPAAWAWRACSPTSPASPFVFIERYGLTPGRSRSSSASTRSGLIAASQLNRVALAGAADRPHPAARRCAPPTPDSPSSATAAIGPWPWPLLAAGLFASSPASASSDPTPRRSPSPTGAARPGRRRRSSAPCSSARPPSPARRRHLARRHRAATRGGDGRLRHRSPGRADRRQPSWYSCEPARSFSRSVVQSFSRLAA